MSVYTIGTRCTSSSFYRNAVCCASCVRSRWPALVSWPPAVHRVGVRESSLIFQLHMSIKTKMSGQNADNPGSWVSKILDDIGQSSCDPAVVRLQLKRIKSIAKRGDSYVEEVFTEAWDALRSQSSMTRLAAMHVCDELFVRSKRFRNLLIDNRFPIFVEQVVAPGKSLPAPKEAAAKLRAMALQSIQQWTRRFGSHHVELTIAYTYLRDAGMISEEEAVRDMPEAQLATTVEPATQPGSPEPDASTQHAQQLLQDIGDSTMALRVCMQCLVTLLGTLGHPVPTHIMPAPEPKIDPPRGNNAENATAAATGGATTGAGSCGEAAAHVATGDHTGASQEEGEEGEEQLEFEDVDWEEHAGSASAVADTMSAAAPPEHSTQQPGRRALPKKIRAAVLTALREGQRAMQKVHVPKLARHREALAEAGVEAGALAVAACGAGAAALPGSCRDVPLRPLRAAAELPELHAAALELLGVLAGVVVPVEEEGRGSAGGTQGDAQAPTGPRRRRVLRGRNEREWPDVAPAPAATVRMRDPAAPNMSDPYTVTTSCGGGTRPSAAGAAAAPRGASAAAATVAVSAAGAVPPRETANNPPRRGGTGEAAGSAPVMPKEAVKRLAAKAPVLPAGDYLRLWDSYESQMEFVQQHMTQGQVYSHWGRVDDDVQLDRAHVENLPAQRAVFHDSLAAAARSPRSAAAGADAAAAPPPSTAARPAEAEPRQRLPPAPEPAPQTAAEFRAAARDHNMSVLARAGRQEVGDIDGLRGAEGGQAGKKRGRESPGARQKLRGVMRKLSRSTRR
eukprot:jgi/Ulvmu1/10311/UM060_0113.1